MTTTSGRIAANRSNSVVTSSLGRFTPLVVVFRAARALGLGQPPQRVAVGAGRLGDRVDAVGGDDAAQEAGERGVGNVDGAEVDALADHDQSVVVERVR